MSDDIFEDPAHKFMNKLKYQKVNNSKNNRRYNDNRCFKFMCGVLNVVVKFSSLNIEFRSKI